MTIPDFLDGISDAFGPDMPGKLLHVQGSPYYQVYPGEFGDLPDSPGEELVYVILPKEYYIYGSNRMGTIKHYDAEPATNAYSNEVGQKSYELTDHLGNVHATISDHRLITDTDTDGDADEFAVDLRTSVDYYPYGMQIPSRAYNHNPNVLVNNFQDVDKEIRSESLTYENTPHFTTADANNYWKAYRWDESGNSMSTLSTLGGNWYLGSNNVEMIHHDNSAKRVKLTREISTTEMPTLDYGDRVKITFMVTKNDANLSTCSPDLSIKVKVKDQNGSTIVSHTYTLPANNYYKTINLDFTALSGSATLEVEGEFKASTCSGGQQIRLFMLRNFHLKHYDVSVTNYTEIVNNQYEVQGDYRYGFNGMEKDDEVKGMGNSYDFGARLYDPRLGRWLTIDPQYKKYPSLSAYAAFGDNPIFYIDPGGETLHVAGMTEKAMDDLRSILPESHKAALYIADDGTVQIDAEKVAYTDNQPPDAGVELMYRLILSDENYEYNVSESVTTATADNSTGTRRSTTVDHNTGTGESVINLVSIGSKQASYNNQIVNASKSIKGRPMTSSLDLYDVPLNESIDGQVTIAPSTNMVYSEDKKTSLKPRASIVFHELWENYNRTSGGQMYDEAHEGANAMERSLPEDDTRRDLGNEGEGSVKRQ